MPFAEIESILACTAREVYSTSLMVLDKSSFRDYCESNEIDVDADFTNDCKKELQDLMRGDLRLTMKQKDYRGLTVALHRVLGLAKFIFAEKLSVVVSSYLKMLRIMTADKQSDEGVDSFRADYSVTSMHLMLQHVLIKTTEQLAKLDVRNSFQAKRRTQAKDFAAMGMHKI